MMQSLQPAPHGLHAGRTARRGVAFAMAWQRLIRPGIRNEPRAWTPAMTLILLVGLACVAAACPLDAPATLYVRSSDSALMGFLADLTYVGLSQWYLIPAGLLFLAIALLDWQARDRLGRSRLAYLFGQAGYAFLAVAVSGILCNVVKLFVGRARPELFDEGGPLNFHPFTPGHDFGSFPSGHSTTLGAVAMVLMLWFPRWRFPIVLVCAFAAATRVAAGAHYPSDVVAGFLLGLLYALFLARWLARRHVAFRFSGGRLFPIPRFRLLPAVPASARPAQGPASVHK